MDKPYLYEAVYKFTQEGNGNGTTDPDEELSITMETCHGSLDEEGGFYTFRTSGWSVDTKEEWFELLEKIKNIKHDK